MFAETRRNLPPVEQALGIREGPVRRAQPRRSAAHACFAVRPRTNAVRPSMQTACRVLVDRIPMRALRTAQARSPRPIVPSACSARTREVRRVVDVELDRALEVAVHEKRMGDARANRRDRGASRAGRRRSTRREARRTGRRAPAPHTAPGSLLQPSNAAEQPHHRLERPACFNLEVGVEMVRQRQIRD